MHNIIIYKRFVYRIVVFNSYPDVTYRLKTKQTLEILGNKIQGFIFLYFFFFSLSSCLVKAFTKSDVKSDQAMNMKNECQHST